MDTGLIISLFIITLSSFGMGLILGLGIAGRQNKQLMLMHAEMMATAFWILSGGELDPEEPKEKPPATVLPFRVKGPDEDTDAKEPHEPF
jgi:hypothetical protein